MARRKRKRTLRPKLPSRVKRRRGGKARRLQHPELWGLALVALGIFLGRSSTPVGTAATRRALARGLDAAVGDASWALPIGLVAVGGLMVMRSALVEVRPFRIGIGCSRAA